MTKILRPERAEKLRLAIRRTQPDLLVVLENVHDPLNINAVLRTCDAVGVRQIFILDSEKGLARDNFKMGKKSSGGVFKYVAVRLFHDVETCLAAARSLNGGPILTAHLVENYVLSHFTKKPEIVLKTIENLQKESENHQKKPSSNLFDLDLTQPTTLVFGNEHFGPTPATLAASDGFFVIPMVGLAQSLNISVAAAVSLYEAFRQRAALGFYDQNPRLDEAAQATLFENWAAMLNEKEDRRTVVAEV